MSVSGTYQAVGLRLLSSSAAVRQRRPSPALGVTAWPTPPPMKIPNRLVAFWLLGMGGFALLVLISEILGSP
jgi:hypothetical protein